MRYFPTILYSRDIPHLSEKIAASIEQGCKGRSGNQPIELFFRADDIGVPSRLFRSLITLFQHHNMPLCLAVVPCWLTQKRYQGLREITGYDDTHWCWHQHGRLHKNFEPHGKKQEFGPARGYAELKSQIELGRARLKSIMGESLRPYFTPPWNRCSIETAQALKDLSFQGISRSMGAKPDVTNILPDIQVNVDLHTRKEPTIEESLSHLLSELERSLANGRCGIMLHHQRMNARAFHLLDLLLTHLAKRNDIVPRLYDDMI